MKILYRRQGRQNLPIFLLSLAVAVVNISTIRAFVTNRYSLSFRFFRTNIPTRFLGSKMSSHAASPTSTATSAVLQSLKFDNRNLRDLPVDVDERIVSRQVANAVFSLVTPQRVLNPRLVSHSSSALKLLGIDIAQDDIESNTAVNIADYFSGNKLFPGSRPAAHCYCGHQFGSFAGQLGDGAAMYLGEVINSSGERWELQIKGAGPTHYSRNSDGRKVLRSSIREYLCSEGIFYLGIPTTRAATCVTSDSTVQRDPLYDGSVINERCTIVSRIAPNFFRFGSFEIFKPAEGRGEGARAGPSAGNDVLKKRLLDHVVSYYPDIDRVPGGAESKAAATESDRGEVYAAFFREVCRRTAELVAKWQSVGFVHGVLNTDNMSVMGLTIDYGPFAFMEHFDPDFVPNGSDSSARYTYERQPEICRWNLGKLAEALAPFVSEDAVRRGLEDFDTVYSTAYMALMRGKLGLLSPKPDDDEFINSLFTTMTTTQADFTDTFQAFTELTAALSNGKSVDAAKEELVEKLVSRSATPSELTAIMRRKMKIHRLGMHPEQVQQLWALLESEPDVVSEAFGGAPLDIIRAELSAEKRKLDMLIHASTEIKRLQTVSPKDKVDADRSAWSSFVTLYLQRLTSESDSESAASQSDRLATMRQHNPTFVLRNWIAQESIDAAEKGDFSKVNTILKMLQTPYDPSFSTFSSNSGTSESASGSTTSGPQTQFTCTAPQGSSGLICTCSS